MARSLQNYVDIIRRKLEDFPKESVTNSTMTTVVATLPIAAGQGVKFLEDMLIEVGTEAMRVTAVAGDVVTVRRGAYGTTATTHASGDVIFIQPLFFFIDIQEVVNECITQLFPWFYIKVMDDTTVDFAATDIDYNLPTAITVADQLAQVWQQNSDLLTYSIVRNWTVDDNASPAVLWLDSNPGKTSNVRLIYEKPFTQLVAAATVTDLPPRALELPKYFSVARLLPSKEARRARFDRLGSRGEQATREKANLTVAAFYEERFQFEREKLRTPRLQRFRRRLM
jgi:hypothetical protein